jgi:soluble lytic murein transglycosylase-like protein
VLRSFHPLFRLLLAAAFVAGLAVPVQAQIYSWSDANGNLVLSDRPHEGAAVRTFAVPKGDSVRTTRFAASDRARAFDDLIVEHARLNSVRPSLVRAVIQVESAFNPRAVSPKGALGLMQLMPATARQFNVVNAFDPEDNVRAGVLYLRQLIDRYDGNEQLALAAYNAGPGAVDRHGQSVPPYRETRSYVSRISEMAGASAASPSTKIYRVVEIVEGREVIRYTDKKPGS